MNRAIVCAMTICFASNLVAADETSNRIILRTQDVIDAVIDGIAFVQHPALEVSPAEVSVIKADLGSYLPSLPMLPDNLDVTEIDEPTRSKILSPKVELWSTDPEYYRNEAAVLLTGSFGAFEIARTMPMPNQTDQAAIEEVVDYSVDRIVAAINRELGEVLDASIVSDFGDRTREDMIAQIQNPLSYAYKRVPTNSALQSALDEFELRLGATRHRLLEDAERLGDPGARFAGNPDPETDYEGFRRAVLQERPLIQLFMVLSTVMHDLTSIPEEDRVVMDSVVPGYAAMAKQVSKLRSRELTQLHARWAQMRQDHREMLEVDEK